VSSLRPRAATIDPSMSDRQITVLGGGNMGRALIGGLLRSGTRPERVSVGEASEAARLVLARELGVSATADNAPSRGRRWWCWR